MYQSKELRRVRRQLSPAPELLEDRVVLSNGEGSTFAIMPGTIATAGQVASTSFKIDPTLFSSPAKSGKIVIGIDIAPATQQTSTGSTTTSSLTPQIVSVTDGSGHVIQAEHTKYDPKVAKANKLGNSPTSAVLVTLNVPKTGQPANDYAVQIKGLNNTTGTYLVGFYLPGDVAGTGTVAKSDLQTIRKDHNMTAENANYNFDADVNRNGVINQQDLMVAQENLGVSTKVDPVVSVNLDPASDPAANRTTPFSTVHFAGDATPDATVSFYDQASGTTTNTTANSTGAYSIMVPLISGSNTFTVTTMDGFGQSITGAISPVVYSPSTTS